MEKAGGLQLNKDIDSLKVMVSTIYETEQKVDNFIKNSQRFHVFTGGRALVTHDYQGKEFLLNTNEVITEKTIGYLMRGMQKGAISCPICKGRKHPQDIWFCEKLTCKEEFERIKDIIPKDVLWTSDDFVDKVKKGTVNWRSYGKRGVIMFVTT